MDGSYELIRETPHLVVVRVIGQLPAKDVNTLTTQVQQTLSEVDHNMQMLVDLSQASSLTTEGRMYLINMMRNHRLSGAVFGAAALLRVMVNLAASVSGASDRLRFFEDEDSARKWLSERE